MPENPPSPPPAPAPAPADKPSRSRPYFNRGQLEDIAVAESICAAASRAPYAAALAARDISAAFITAFKATIKEAREKAGDTLGASVSRESKTLLASGAERDLVLALQEIQAAAKQKFFRTDPARLQSYAVGARLNASRSALIQTAMSICDTAENDALPGITAAKIAAARAKLAALEAAGATQEQQTAAAVDLRVERDALIRTINDHRMTVQFAADAEYPYSDEENHAARKEFHLPLSRPLGA